MPDEQNKRQIELSLIFKIMIGMNFYIHSLSLVKLEITVDKIQKLSFIFKLGNAELLL